MPKKTKVLVAVICMATLLMTTFGSSSIGIAQVTDSPAPGQLRINCGSVSGFIQEQYLYINNGSNAETEKLKLQVNGVIMEADIYLQKDGQTVIIILLTAFQSILPHLHPYTCQW